MLQLQLDRIPDTVVDLRSNVHALRNNMERCFSESTVGSKQASPLHVSNSRIVLLLTAMFVNNYYLRNEFL